MGRNDRDLKGGDYLKSDRGLHYSLCCRQISTSDVQMTSLFSRIHSAAIIIFFCDFMFLSFNTFRNINEKA